MSTRSSAKFSSLSLLWSSKNEGMAQVKILFWDGTGMCLFYKRLDAGRFRLLDTPSTGATHVELNEMELDALLDGVDLEKPRRRAPQVH